MFKAIVLIASVLGGKYLEHHVQSFPQYPLDHQEIAISTRFQCNTRLKTYQWPNG